MVSEMALGMWFLTQLKAHMVLALAPLLALLAQTESLMYAYR